MTTSLSLGWHADMSEEQYHSLELCSNSSLTTIYDKSPAHLRYELDHKEEFDASKPIDIDHALAFGTAVHLAILQPELFLQRYARCPDGMKLNTNAGKDAWAQTLADNPGKFGMRAEAFDACGQISARVHENTEARLLIESNGAVEATGIWKDEENDLICKMRLDKLSSEYSAVIDVKTCQSAHPRDFANTILNRGYHRQAAMYRAGCRALGAHVENYYLVAVEKDGNFEAAVYRLNREATQLGEEQLAPLLRRYKQCESSGQWPGYQTEISDISLPMRAFYQEQY